MEFEKYTEFEKFVLIPVGRHLRREYDDSYADYNNDLSRKHRGILQEIRENKLKYSEDRDALLQYFNDMFLKVTELKGSLFRDTSTVPYFIYLLEDTEPEGVDNPHNRSIMVLKRMVYSIYDRVNSDYQLIKGPHKSCLVKTPTQHKERIPDRGSFMLRNPDVNFNAIHARLLAEPQAFIDPRTTVDILRNVFIGINVTEKVIWYNANSLRYFIHQLLKHDLIERPNEGQWRRTIKCFKSEDGEFAPDDLKDTKDPANSITILLDDIIALFTH